MAVEGNGKIGHPDRGGVAQTQSGSPTEARPATPARTSGSLDRGLEGPPVYVDWMNPDGPTRYTNLDMRLMAGD